jgi:hypothetical protein
MGWVRDKIGGEFPGPGGAEESSHGRSAASPWNGAISISQPRRGAGKGHQSCISYAPSGRKWVLAIRFHGFRCAAPVAMLPRPFGARNLPSIPSHTRMGSMGRGGD